MKAKVLRRHILTFIGTGILFFAGLFGAVPSGLRAEGISGQDNQTINVDPTGKGEGYSDILYDNTNGLPTSEANAIAETSEGFIWIGSYSGLVRYDGNTFERIDSTSGIASVVSLYVDSSDRLWIGTNDNGVAVMEKGEYRTYGEADGLGSSSIRSFVEDREGNVYVATTHGIAMIGKDMVLHPVDEAQINDEYVCELRCSTSGIIYGETMKGDIFTLENGRLTGFYDDKKLGIESVYTVLPDPDKEGYVYIGTEQGKIYYGELSSGLTDVSMMDVSVLGYINSMEKIRGQLWICAERGVGMIENGEFTRLEGLKMNNSVGRMLADYQGNLWFTSSRQGVLKIVPNRFMDIFDRYDLDTEVVNSTCRQGSYLYIGTDNGLMIVRQGVGLTDVSIERTTVDERTVDTLTGLFEGCRIRSITEDSRGRLWFATYSSCGLVMYEDHKVSLLREEEGMPSNRARTVYECEDGSYLVGCSGGLALIRDGAVSEVYDKESGLGNVEVLTCTEGLNGDYILGTDGGGIYVIDSANKVTNVGRPEGLESEVILRIRKDTGNKLYWVITSNSLAYMTADYRVITVKNFPYSNNFDLFKDQEGKVWILSSNGIYVVDADTLIKNEEISPVFYNRSKGLPCVPTANSFSGLDADGNLYISGTTGAARVNINSSFEDVGELKMAVPYVDADGTRIYADENGDITIPASTKRLTIYSYVYTYSLINPDVTYSLEGFDQSSITVARDELEPLVYTNLDGGEYSFVMEVEDSMNSGSRTLRVRIVKTKAIFEQVWFRVLVIILAVVLILAGILIFVRRKTRRLLAKQNQQKMFIREMIEAFAKVIDMKDKYTNGHSGRVAEYTAMLTKELGYDDETVENYYNIALLHDIGKIGIPSEVLNKPGKLTDDEFKIIKSHSALGYRVLKDISIMPELAVGAGAHHERPDGKGYPKGLKGDEIPRVAQIIAVADTFDAMYSDRPYRKRMNFDRAVSIIREVSGTQLAPDVVEAFLRLVDKGVLRDPEDHGGGTMEDIDNIHKRQDEAERDKNRDKEQNRDRDKAPNRKQKGK